MPRDAVDAKKKAQPGRGRGRPPIVRDFYGSALVAAEAIAHKYAGDIDGLDKEIALLRTKLRTLVNEREEENAGNVDLKLMFRGMDLLTRMVATHYRLSPEAQKDLTSSIAGIIDGVAAQFYPEGRDGA